MNKQEWSTALKAFAQAQRQQNPIPNRDTLSDEEEAMPHHWWRIH